jgi:4-aminobutyrate--pyruvate transaminase
MAQRSSWSGITTMRSASPRRKNPVLQECLSRRDRCGGQPERPVNNHRDFDLPIDRILHVDCPHHYRFGLPGEREEDFATRLADAIEQRILEEGPDTVGAFIAEPLMGAGGVIVPPATYFEKVQRVLRKYEVLLIADEVICGFCRTGSTTFGMQPDILTCAKALSSGYVPISAVMVNETVMTALAANCGEIGIFGHGYTYSGHPVSCAVALETLRIYEEEEVLQHVQSRAPRFQQGLCSFAGRPLVGEVRGIGLIGAIELAANPAERQPFDPAKKLGARMAQLALEQGLIVRAMGDVVAFCPPLIITGQQVDDMFGRFALAMGQLAQEFA